MVGKILAAALWLASSAPGAATNSPALAARLAEVQKLAPRGFTVFDEPPFVVAGDEPAARVHQHALHTIRWAVDKLKQDFFQRDPAETIAIWLFKDRASYDRHTRTLFHDQPTTPFGYYSEQHNALIMNIATGGGTLVHEIVHPFMRANFPQCPAWFNEGLGSLYEQCAERDGHIQGLPNWRLPALQKALRAGDLMTFQKLTTLSIEEFYGGEHNPHYSQFYPQARYLCYYLQERGLLIRYYREFTAHAAADPTGYATLQKVLGEPDMDAFTKKWAAFTLNLKFP